MIIFRTKNRKAWLVPACLSTKKETMYVTFAALGHVGHISLDPNAENNQKQMVNVTCLPLYSILMALDNPPIDYFSLDVEGFELDVLKTIPFDKVNVKVASKMSKICKNKYLDNFSKLSYLSFSDTFSGVFSSG